MLKISRSFLTRSEDGQQEVTLCECLVETDTTTMHNVNNRTTPKDRYFREANGDMRAMGAEEIEPGVFRLSNGLVVRQIKED
jgi:hypothetical protein